MNICSLFIVSCDKEECHNFMETVSRPILVVFILILKPYFNTRHLVLDQIKYWLFDIRYYDLDNMKQLTFKN